MTFALTGLMLYTMWIVLGLIAIDILVSIYNNFNNNTFTLSSLSSFLNGVLTYVFPLYILANLMPLDPTNWIIQIAYYVGAIGVIFKYLTEIKNKL